MWIPIVLGVIGGGAVFYWATRPGRTGTVVQSLMPGHWYAVTTTATGAATGPMAQTNVGLSLRSQGFTGSLTVQAKQGPDGKWYVKAIGPFAGGQAFPANTSAMQVLQVEEVNPPAILLTPGPTPGAPKPTTPSAPITTKGPNLVPGQSYAVTLAVAPPATSPPDEATYLNSAVIAALVPQGFAPGSLTTLTVTNTVHTHTNYVAGTVIGQFVGGQAALQDTSLVQIVSWAPVPAKAA